MADHGPLWSRGQLAEQLQAYANLQLLPGRREPQTSQPEPQPPVARGRRDYANLPSGGRPAEMSDPQLNYMDLDFSTGRGLPAGSAPYARLRWPERGAVASGQPQEPPRPPYAELDFRAMTALAATAQAGRRREPPTCRGRQARPESPFARLRAAVSRSLGRLAQRCQSKPGAGPGADSG